MKNNYKSLSQEELNKFNKVNSDAGQQAVKAVIKKKEEIERIALTVGLMVCSIVFTLKAKLPVITMNSIGGSGNIISNSSAVSNIVEEEMMMF